jgi:hypothetical protein
MHGCQQVLLTWLKASDLLTTAVKTEARAASWLNQVEVKFADYSPVTSVLDAVAEIRAHLQLALLAARECKLVGAGSLMTRQCGPARG